MQTENLNPYIDFYTPDGEHIHNDELGEHDLQQALMSFSGAKPQPFEDLSCAQMRAVSAWLSFLAADSEVTAEAATNMLDIFKGYPQGTTLGQIVSGTAQKIVRAVE